MKERDNKRMKRNQIMISVFIAFIMTTSVIGYMWMRDTNPEYKYNNFKFSKIQNKWVAEINKIKVEFDYHPSEILNINASNDVISMLSGKIEIDATYDANSSKKEGISYSIYEMNKQLKNSRTYLRQGFISENEFKMPVITCNQSTITVPVIYFMESNETQIYLKDNCIIIEGKKDIDFIMAKDRIVYGIFGVIS